MCLYLDAFCRDFCVSIRKIDKLREEYVKKVAGQPPPPHGRIEFDGELNKEICDAIDFQAEIVE